MFLRQHAQTKAQTRCVSHAAKELSWTTAAVTRTAVLAVRKSYRLGKAWGFAVLAERHTPVLA